MRIALLLACTLSACSCAVQQPLVSRDEIATIEHDYVKARDCEEARGPVGRLDYDAAASLVTAQTERTAAAVKKAREDVAVFAQQACHAE